MKRESTKHSEIFIESRNTCKIFLASSSVTISELVNLLLNGWMFNINAERISHVKEKKALSVPDIRAFSQSQNM